MSLVPYDDRDGFIWMDGAMTPWRDVKVHVLTHALHYASCVFEGERVYDGRIFKLAQHTARLANSAEVMRICLLSVASTSSRLCRICSSKIRMRLSPSPVTIHTLSSGRLAFRPLATAVARPWIECMP